MEIGCIRGAESVLCGKASGKKESLTVKIRANSRKLFRALLLLKGTGAFESFTAASASCAFARSCVRNKDIYLDINIFNW